MKDVTIDPRGGPVQVEVRCGHGHAGAYRLRVWEGDDQVFAERGTFSDPTDDDHVLPGAAEDQVGRRVQCRASVELLPPSQEYALVLTIRQDGVELGSEVEEGETEEPEVIRTLWVGLVAE